MNPFQSVNLPRDNYGKLRNEIVSYFDHNRHLDFVATFSDTLNIVEDGEDIASLDTIIKRQYRNGEYGSELLFLLPRKN